MVPHSHLNDVLDIQSPMRQEYRMTLFTDLRSPVEFQQQVIEIDPYKFFGYNEDFTRVPIVFACARIRKGCPISAFIRCRPIDRDLQLCVVVPHT
jgi:hypothetical protein